MRPRRFDGLEAGADLTPANSFRGALSCGREQPRAATAFAVRKATATTPANASEIRSGAIHEIPSGDGTKLGKNRLMTAPLRRKWGDRLHRKRATNFPGLNAVFNRKARPRLACFRPRCAKQEG